MLAQISMTTTIAKVELKNIQKIYKLINTYYPEHNERFLYFLATCLHLEPDVNLETALKLRPYGGIIGIHNTSLDTCLKSYNVLRLQAILQDASRFIAKGSRILLRFALSNHKRFRWSPDWFILLRVRENVQI